MDRVGLCATCKHVRIIDSGRGSRFYMCTEAQRDPRLKKYPPLPVISCFAYERVEAREQQDDEPVG